MHRAVKDFGDGCGIGCAVGADERQGGGFGQRNKAPAIAWLHKPVPEVFQPFLPPGLGLRVDVARQNIGGNRRQI
jgi:hypothetical protein